MSSEALTAARQRYVSSADRLGIPALPQQAQKNGLQHVFRIRRAAGDPVGRPEHLGVVRLEGLFQGHGRVRDRGCCRHAPPCLHPVLIHLDRAFGANLTLDTKKGQLLIPGATDPLTRAQPSN
jgi:hypothetical protein